MKSESQIRQSLRLFYVSGWFYCWWFVKDFVNEILNWDSIWRRDIFFSSVVKTLPYSGCFTTCMSPHFSSVDMITWSGLARFSRFQGSCGMVPNVLAGLNHYVKLRQILGERWMSKIAFRFYLQIQIRKSAALEQSPPAELPGKMFEIRSSVSCGFGHYVDSILPVWLLALTLYMCMSFQVDFCVFMVLGCNYGGRISHLDLF